MAKAPRLNDQIRISPVRLIDHENEQRGVVDTYEALQMARELGLDLVEIAPQERPPVCRIMDYGKHKYNLKKKQKNNVSHDVVLKEVRMRPKTDDNDRTIKMNRAEKFLSQGHKVQFTMLFRGRERQHRDLALRAFQEIAERFAETSKIERHPKFEGRRMTMMLAPVARPVAKKPPKPPKVKPAKAPSGETPPPVAPTPPPAAEQGAEQAKVEVPTPTATEAQQ